MITVTITLHDARVGGQKMLGRLDICNDGTGTETLGNYVVGKLDGDAHLLGNGQIKNYARQERDVWDLVWLALDSVSGDRDRPKIMDGAMTAGVKTRQIALAGLAYGNAYRAHEKARLQPLGDYAAARDAMHEALFDLLKTMGIDPIGDGQP